MALLEQWQKVAYNEKADRGELQRFWQRYFLLEKGVYEQLLTNPDEKVEGTVKELAEKYNLSVMEMTGFLDGINDSLVEANPIDTMEEDTKVNLVFDKEKLYKNMVDAKADWLYELPQWNAIFDEEKKKQLYREQKQSGTIRKGKKIGRTINFPTANILPAATKLLPPNGVYATRTNINGKSYRSITNVGINPTISENNPTKVETYVANFHGNLYGEVIEVSFYEFMRGERKFDDIKEEKGVEFDTDLTAEDLKEVVAIYKEEYKKHAGVEFPQDPKVQLMEAIKAVFRSWNNDRAITYRRLNDIPGSWGTAVNVQQMVYGNTGDTSGTGVAFTRNPATGEKKLFGEYLMNAQGEDVVAGIRTPQPIATLNDVMPECYEQFCKVCDILEEHYRDMQDMEFTIENGKLFMLQTRNGKRTAQAALKIANQEFDDAIVIKSKDEIGSLAHSIDLMRKQLKENIVQLHLEIDKVKELESLRKDFINQFTHEMKTPLGIINGYSELIDETDNNEEREKYLDIINRETARINALIQSMLSLSRLEAGKVELKKQKFDLEDIVTEIIDEYEILFMKKNIHVVVHKKDSIIYADCQLIETVLHNFISNAIKHTYQNGNIIINIDNGVSVYNDGDLILEDRLGQIWYTFVTHDKEGSGLGLAICRSILELHDFEYGVQNKEQGVEFYFKNRR